MLEFRYRDPVINSDDVIIAISQSGETADTLAAIELKKVKELLFMEFTMLWDLLFLVQHIQVHISMWDQK